MNDLGVQATCKEKDKKKTTKIDTMFLQSRNVNLKFSVSLESFFLFLSILFLSNFQTTIFHHQDSTHETTTLFF